MKKMRKYLYWLPRVLAIAFILFLSIFALDVFGEPYWFIGLVIHLIPSFVLAIITSIAWKNDQIGAVLFIVASVGMFLFFGSFILASPLLIVGILFLANNYYHIKPRS